MTPAQFDLLSIKLGDVQSQLGAMEEKEDILLAILEQVQKKLESPSIVEPRFPAWAVWLFGSFAVVGIVSCVVLMINVLL